MSLPFCLETRYQMIDRCQVIALTSNSYKWHTKTWVSKAFNSNKVPVSVCNTSPSIQRHQTLSNRMWIFKSRINYFKKERNKKNKTLNSGPPFSTRPVKSCVPTGILGGGWHLLGSRLTMGSDRVSCKILRDHHLMALGGRSSWNIYWPAMGFSQPSPARVRPGAYGLYSQRASILWGMADCGAWTRDPERFNWHRVPWAGIFVVVLF